MSGEILFVLFLGAAVASVVISAREYAAERRMAEGRPTETEMRRWTRKARRAWHRSTGRKERVP